VKIFYGLASRDEIKKIAVRVCELLNPTNVPESVEFILEICAAETGLGTVRDTFEREGRGLTQFDKIRFDEVKARLISNKKLCAEIDQELGIDATRVAFEHLDYSPMLSILFTRAALLQLPESIPKTRQPRAELWKKRWNSAAGDGTAEGYIEKTKKYLGY
jgi:hypothetical protein